MKWYNFGEDEWKKGIAPQDWQKLLDDLKEKLPEDLYWIVMGILESHATRYL